ncbi:PKD domain-containing protein [[Eubacterium] cellulosolvens]
MQKTTNQKLNESNNQAKKSSKNNSKSKTSRKLKAIAIALYITFLLLSSIPFIADRTIEPYMKEDYEYHLTYPRDGQQSHYYVERVDASGIGTIDLAYTTASNTLDIETQNIEVLYIYCRSMYEDECLKVFGFDPRDNSNYYKWYFIEKNHLTVIIDSDHIIKELAFIDTPVPYQVIVNGLRWYEGKHYNYTNNYGTVLSHVPEGNVHVDIYFKANDKTKPYASFKSDKTFTNINTLINFDASESFDIDGVIESYIWDFGDGFNSGGVKNAHSYSKPGVYGVILTVRDDDFLTDQTILNITILQGSNRPRINGIVPNQIKTEDSPPWELDLLGYGIDLDSSPAELRWYLTGEDTELYQVLGENSTDQKFIFSTHPNIFGSDLVTLWLNDKDGNNVSQPLWINITSVNDKPVIKSLPNLMVHSNVPYHFNLTSYIYDVETPKELLSVTAQDPYGTKYVYSKGHELTFFYPNELLDEIILTTVTVSDGEMAAETIISVTVSTNWPPVLILKLPDIELYEGTAKLDAFKLDDYFMDPDDDDLYYTFSESNVMIYLKENSSVDLTSQNDWTGEEEVIFRARDSYGGIVEDIIKITVIPINDPPTIGDVPDIMVHFDMDYYFDLSYYISDSDNEDYELTLTTSDPTHIRLNPNNHLGIVLNYPRSMLGITSRVILTVSDGLLQVDKTISVLVIPEYPPELVQPLPDIIFNEDEKLINFIDLDEYFMDYDNDSLFYTTGNIMVNISINVDHLVSLTPVKDWFGTEQVTFRATDPIGALVEAPIFITVLPINDAPVLARLPKIILNESEVFEINLEKYITDVDTNISKINIIVSDPNVIVTGTSLIIFGTQELPDVIDIILTDGDERVNGELRVKVLTKSNPENNLTTEILIIIIVLIAIIILISMIISYVYFKGQQFEIEEIFLIHNSGKLLSHVYSQAHSKFDDDIFSGMFTAIQEFIEDSLSDGSIGPQPLPGLASTHDYSQATPMKLNEFKVGNNQVIVEHGIYIYMAVVYQGRGALTLHRLVRRKIQAIEKKFDTDLEFWDGDMRPLHGIKRYLEKMIARNKQKKKPKKSIQGPRGPKKIVIAKKEPRRNVTFKQQNLLKGNLDQKH